MLNTAASTASAQRVSDAGLLSAPHEFVLGYSSPMYLVVVGVLLLAAKMAEWGPFATLSWWIVLAPFFGAIVWWHFADTSGLTKQREMARMEERRKRRREKAMQALGMDTARDKRATDMRNKIAGRKLVSGAESPTEGPAAGQADAGSSRSPRSADPTH